MKIFDLESIKKSINITKDFEELLSSQKSAFIDFSGLYDVPSPMQFIFPALKSDFHIKGGYTSQNLVIKIASSGRFGNNGMIIIFDASTGEVKAILHDQGFLTTLRTAIAGVIAAELIPWEVKNIGIIGSGNLAAQLYELVRLKYPKLNVILYARNKTKATKIADSVCDSVDDLLKKCDIVFTTTSAQHPMIHDLPQGINKGIIALGSDDEHKSEISPDLFDMADIVIVDSKSQAAKFGDIARALRAGIITPAALIELGEALKLGTAEKAKTIIADFSGIGAQDVAMAEFVLTRLL